MSINNVFRLNATSFLAFGTLFILTPDRVAMFLSDETQASVWLITVIGAVLNLNGLHLIWASFLSSPSRELILYFALGDVIWVCAVTTLIISGLWITTSDGVLAAIMINIVVGLFAIMQMMALKSATEGSSEQL